MTGRHRGLVAGLLTLVVGFSGACRDGDGQGTADGDAARSGSTTTSGPATTTAPTTVIGPTTPSAGRVITVVVSRGMVEGGVRREQVPAGQPLTLRILSDTADEVRVDGYDGVSEDVPAGGTARLTFTPDKPGVFTVELVEDRLKLLELEVA